jgi:hypothetical protein
LLDHLLPDAVRWSAAESAVVGVATTFDVTAVLKLVDVGNDPARQQPQLAAERLLTAPGIGRDRPQDPGVRGSEVDRRDQVGEHRGGPVAELGQ